MEVHMYQAFRTLELSANRTNAAQFVRIPARVFLPMAGECVWNPHAFSIRGPHFIYLHYFQCRLPGGVHRRRPFAPGKTQTDVS